MRALLPYPLVSACLLAMWLLLNQTVAAGQILLGCVLALVGGWVMMTLKPPPARIRRPGAIIRLSFVVLVDIIRSNYAVARIILGLRHRSLTSGFLNIPLDLHDRYGLAVLASIITATPGTLWVNYDTAKGVVTIHVLDLIDEDAWIGTIKGRYERLLLEIFE